MPGRWAHATMVALVAAGCRTGPAPSDPPTVDRPRTIDVQGHRGARGLRPEHTRAGFALAAALGVTTLELDLHLTADDRLVVWHDPQIAPTHCRVPSARSIRAMTLAQLQTIVCDRNPDVTRFADQRAPADEDYHLMALSDVLQLPLAEGLSFNVELKRAVDDPTTIGDGFDGVNPATFERVLVRTLREGGVVDRTIVQSFDHRALWAVATLEPRLALAALTDSTAELQTIADRGASIWSPRFVGLTAAEVRRAHALGLRVIPWTINARDDLEHVLALGVDGVISDRPDVAVSVARGYGRVAPVVPATPR